MKWLMPPVVLLALMASSAAVAEEWAQQMFKTSSHNFGTIARAAKAECEFTFQNTYEEDVHVASVRSSCGCTSVRVKDNKETLKTWETGAIVAHINSDKFLGTKGATITVTFDRPYHAEVRLQVRTYIRDDVVLNPGSIQFGSVSQGTAGQQRLAVGLAGQTDWRILDVKSDNPHLSGEVVEAAADGGRIVYHLTVRLDAGAPAGYLRDHVMLLTNDSQRSQIPVAVEGRVVSTVSVGPRMLSLGVVKPGEKVSKQVVVRGKEPFRIVQIEAEGDGFEFPVASTEKAKPFHVIPVTFVAGRQQQGTIVQTIRIQTDLGDSVAEFSAQAIVAGAAAETAVQPEAAPQPSVTTTATASTAIPPAPQATPSLLGRRAAGDRTAPQADGRPTDPDNGRQGPFARAMQFRRGMLGGQGGR